MATNRKVAKTSKQTLILTAKLFAFTFFIIPLRKLFQPKKSLNGKTTSAVKKDLVVLVENGRTRFSHKAETPRRGLDQKNADEDMSRRAAAGWRMLAGQSDLR